MNVTIDPSLDADADLRAAVAARAGLLEGVFNGSATAEWRKGTNWEGKPAAQLRLHDATGAQAGADLLPFEFLTPDKLEARFRDLRDALQVVRDWRAAVAQLFATLRPWCAALPGAPEVRESEIVVTERRSGSYTAPQLVVVRNHRAMLVYPVGAWVLGADGRVDLKGPGDRRMLHYSRATGSWCHVPNDAPYRELSLTEALFRELAEACFDD